MYYLQTTSINQTTKDSSPKSDIDYRKATEKLRASYGETMGSYKRRHRDISTIDIRLQPWMKNFTLSSKDLIWGSCDPIEEQFMSISNVTNASVPIKSPSSPMISTKSSLSDNIPIATNSRDRHEHEYPRFRQDLIMDREDVDLQMLELQATTLQRSSSLSNSPPVSSPREKLALRAGVMDQTDPDFPFSCESEHAKHVSCGQISADDEEQGQSVMEQGGRPPDRNAGGTRLYPSPYATTSTCEHTIDERGSQVRIHDEERVYAAMKNGTARLVQCVGCSRHMLATRDIELVYCPGCGTITPIEIGGLPDSPSCCESVARRQQQEN